MVPPKKKSRSCYGEINESENSDELKKITDALNEKLNRAAQITDAFVNMPIKTAILRGRVDILNQKM